MLITSKYNNCLQIDELYSDSVLKQYFFSDFQQWSIFTNHILDGGCITASVYCDCLACDFN